MNPVARRAGGAACRVQGLRNASRSATSVSRCLAMSSIEASAWCRTAARSLHIGHALLQLLLQLEASFSRPSRRCRICSARARFAAEQGAHLCHHPLRRPEFTLLHLARACSASTRGTTIGCQLVG